MQIYHYSHATGEYLRTSDARPDPLDTGRYLIPANATDQAPTTPGEHEAVRWSGSAWEIVPDYRDNNYYDPATAEPHPGLALGDLPPDGWPSDQPPAAKLGVRPHWDGAKWAFDLTALRAAKQGELLVSVNRFIERKPNGLIRYDTNLKLNLLQASVNAAHATKAKPAPVVSIEGWIAAVQREYFALKSLIESADEATLDSMDVGYDWFEAKYGEAGSALPDPDVSSADLVA